MPSWKKFNLNDFHISKKGRPYLFAKLNTEGLKGVQPATKAVFFPHKIVDGKLVVVPEELNFQPQSRRLKWVSLF